MKFSKRLLCLTFALACCLSLCACAATQPPVKTIKIPDIEKLDVSTAKTLLAGKGLIPKVEYEYNNDYDYDLVIRTEPAIGSEVEEDAPVTLYVCKGPSYYELPASLSSIYNVDGIKDFIPWTESDDGIGTKGHYQPYVEDGYLYLPVYLKCTSSHELAFYGNWGTAAINDTFDKTVPIDVIYDTKTIDNKGGLTEFKFKIPLTDLGVQKPTNLYIRTDFSVNGEKTVFRADFVLTW